MRPPRRPVGPISRAIARAGLLAVPLALLLTATSCEEESGTTSEPEAAKSHTPKRPKAEKKAVTAEAQENEQLSYSYNPIGKRDPFRSFIAKEVVPVEKGGEETSLQKYEIDQYRLVGIIWGTDNPVAMVEDPDGMGYFLQRDTLIGRNWGKVVRISPTEVVVAEEYRDFEGKLIVNEIPLKLPSDEKE